MMNDDDLNKALKEEIKRAAAGDEYRPFFYLGFLLAIALGITAIVICNDTQPTEDEMKATAEMSLEIDIELEGELVLGKQIEGRIVRREPPALENYWITSVNDVKISRQVADVLLLAIQQDVAKALRFMREDGLQELEPKGGDTNAD